MRQILKCVVGDVVILVQGARGSSDVESSEDAGDMDSIWLRIRYEGHGGLPVVSEPRAHASEKLDEDCMDVQELALFQET